MQERYIEYLNESVDFITDIIIKRYYRLDASIEDALYRQIRDIIMDTTNMLVKKYGKIKPTKKKLTTEIKQLVMKELKEFPFEKQHTIRSKIAKIKNPPKSG